MVALTLHTFSLTERGFKIDREYKSSREQCRRENFGKKQIVGRLERCNNRCNQQVGLRVGERDAQLPALGPTKSQRLQLEQTANNPKVGCKLGPNHVE